MPEGHPPHAGRRGERNARGPSAHAEGARRARHAGGMPQGHPPMSGTGRAPPTAEELLKQLDSTEGLRDAGEDVRDRLLAGQALLHERPDVGGDDVLPPGGDEGVAPRASCTWSSARSWARQPVTSAEEAGCGFTPGHDGGGDGEGGRGAREEGRHRGRGGLCAGRRWSRCWRWRCCAANALYLTGDAEGALQVYEPGAGGGADE